MRQFSSSDDETISVRVEGQGPPLVLLHEWASDHRVWAPVVEFLKSRFTIYRWDARGHSGRSLTGREKPGVGRMAEDFRDMLGHFGIVQPVVAGHSMGALIMWEYISRYGCSAISHLCFLDQSPKLITDRDWHLGIYYDWSRERNVEFVQQLRTDFVETVMRFIAFGKNGKARKRYELNTRGVKRLRAYFAGLNPAPLIDIWESLAAADWRPILPGLDAPTLLIYGSQSNYYGVELGEYMRDAIPGSRLIIYEGADHSPHVAEPGRFAADLCAFVEE